MKNTVVFETLTLPNCLPHYGQIRYKHNLELTYIALKNILKLKINPYFGQKTPKSQFYFLQINDLFNNIRLKTGLTFYLVLIIC